MILLHAYFGAKRSHLAFVAQGLPRITDMAAEPDHPVVDLAPFGLREQFDQILFDVHGIGMLGEPEAPGDALDVRVHGKALVDAESAPQDHVGRLAGHAGQFDEVLHGVGRFAVEFLHDELRGGDEVFCLAVIEPDGVDDFLELGDGGLGEGRRIGASGGRVRA